jgi:L-amino acid N-acyltransferase YncA
MLANRGAPAALWTRDGARCMVVDPSIRIAAPADYDVLAPLTRLLYEEFFRLARAAGRSRLCAITAPVNARSSDFHQAMGFTVTGPIAGYNGPGHDMLVFERTL